jgi:hypothetical protein
MQNSVSPQMKQNSNKLVKIGEGDDVVNQWYKGFEDIMPEIVDHISFAVCDRFKIEWSVVMKGLAGFEAFLKKKEPSFDTSTAWRLLEELPSVSVTWKQWGGDSPGRSGCFIKMKVPKQELASVRQTMSKLLEALQAYWANAERISVEDEKRLIVERRKEDERKALLKQQQKALKAVLNPIRKFIKEPSASFFEHENFLVKQDGSIFVIVQNSYYSRPSERLMEAIKKLTRQGHAVIEVEEYYPPKTPYLSIWAGEFRKKQIGWRQNLSLLRASSEEFAEAARSCRESYIRWLAQDKTN